MSKVRLDAGAEKTLRKLWKTDSTAARKIQEVIDEIQDGILPVGSEYLTNATQVRSILGVLPHKVARGKLRVIFVPGERVLAVGYRRNIYGFIGRGQSN